MGNLLAKEPHKNVSSLPTDTHSVQAYCISILISLSRYTMLSRLDLSNGYLNFLFKVQ
jgi:hypothetical protein